MLGGSYTIIDYVYDIAQLLHQTRATPSVIMGHSLGGSISLLYSGIYPENVTKLISIEGMGPPPGMFDMYGKTGPHARLEAWVGNLRQLSGRMPKRYSSLEDAFQRMQTENPHLSEDQARHLTIHGSNQNEDGSYSWKFDNYVRAFAPIGLSPEETWKIYARIDCPTLLIHGTESWASNPQDDGRSKAFNNSSVAGIEGAGHWVHHDQLGRFLDVTREFLNS
jgi:pimeloyl-ACP methyl ester carboxylesterase|tara:strand:- start:6321 stop:6986 length:666 start_codon:yes stop_codon:yes gene_type:complete